MFNEGREWNQFHIPSNFDVNLFFKLFVQSGYADKFERGNPAIVVGMSGIELAKQVILYAYPNWKFSERIFSQERSNVYQKLSVSAPAIYGFEKHAEIGGSGGGFMPRDSVLPC